MAQPRTVDPTGKQQGDRMVGVRVTKRQRAELDRLAKRRGVTVSELLRELVRQELESAA